MMKKRTLTCFWAALFVTCLATPDVVLGQADRGTGFAVSIREDLKRGENRKALEQVARVLQLTREQFAAWGDILRARGEAISPLMEQSRTLKLDMGEAIRAESPMLIGELYLDGMEIRKAMGTLKSEAIAGMLDVLTSEQVERLKWVNRAARVAPAIPAFRALGLIRDGSGDRGSRK